MCGIVGVTGRDVAVEDVLCGLSALEYRGYDSAGLAALNDGAVNVRRAKGKIVNLRNALSHAPLFGDTVIGHTRWATHGKPDERNAHPHQVGRVAVVHNGIIENHHELSLLPQLSDWERKSDTDTEVIAALLNCAKGDDFQSVFLSVIEQLHGRYAIAAICEDEPGRVYFARSGSPLVLGACQGAFALGSDAVALAHLTNEICYIADGDWGFLEKDRAVVSNRRGDVLNPVWQTVDVGEISADKGNFEHFMHKEIYDQADVARQAIMKHEHANWSYGKDVDWASLSHVSLTACGTASFACDIARVWFEELAGLHSWVDIASEFISRPYCAKGPGLQILVSQSGETADTLAALNVARLNNLPVLSVVNVETSSLARDSDVVVPVFAGNEVAVASTKAFTAQLLGLLTLVLNAMDVTGRHVQSEAMRKSLKNLPELIDRVLACEDVCKDIGVSLAGFENALFLGRGSMFPIAREAALKLAEITYIHAQAYPSGELKHGPLALVDENMPVVVFAPSGPTFEKTISNMREVQARGGKVILISDKAGIEQAGDNCWKTIALPDIDPVLAPIVYAIPAQMMAYHAAVYKGEDVDQPRNLAKSVTVE